MLKYIVPIFIVFIIITGLKEKKDVYSLFIDGLIEGSKTVYKIFPYIFAITIAINLFKDSNVLYYITYPIKYIFNINEEILTLAFLRPLSGSASTPIVMDIFSKFGPDSNIGKIASIMMGATETTIYTITILFSTVKIKNIRGTLIAGLIADFVSIVLCVLIVEFGII